MVCVICPTATAAAVITSKLGGSAASLTTYTLIANIGQLLRSYFLSVNRGKSGYQFYRCISGYFE